MPEHGSKRRSGLEPGLFDRSRRRRSPVKTTATEQKLPTFGLNTLAIQTTQ